MQLDLFGSNERENEICQRYWEIDSDKFKWNISQIAKEFGISSYEVQKISKNNSRAYSHEDLCQHCGAPYIYSSRQSYLSSRPYKWVCDDCQSDLKIKKEEEKISAINKAINQCPKISLEALDAREAVLLLALLRHSASEDLSCLNELFLNNSEPLSPSHEYSISILKELFSSRLIVVSPDSNLEQITTPESGGFTFYLDRVKWFIPLEEGVELSSLIAGLEEKVSSMGYIDTDYEGVSSLCWEVSLKECLAYLNLVLGEHGFDFSPGEKTELVINRALQTLSVAQVYNLIWRAGKDAASYYLRSNVSKKQAANVVVGSIERSLERSIANDWEIKPYRRNYNAPQSVLSRVLFNVLLHTDDGGFHQVLKEII